MSVAGVIARRIKHMRKGSPFSRTLFADVGSRGAVDKALARLVRSGQLVRVFRGVYMRPKFSLHLGMNLRPSPIRVMEVIAKLNGETIEIHGAEAIRRFGLSTQMQVVPTFYTSGASRELRFGKAVVRLVHVSPDRLQHAGTRVGLALSALHYLGRNGLSKLEISTIIGSLSDDELSMLTSCRMPAWMRSSIECE
ncbi:DUF6088 family protein [Pseudomonas aeruginosa]